jgi:hypothetical protein
VVRSTVRRQSKFQSVSGRGPRRVWGEAGSQLGALSLFLTEQQAPHRSRELSKTSGLYSAVTATTGYLYVVCIYDEMYLCSIDLRCIMSPKSRRYFARFFHNFFSQATKSQIYKFSNYAHFYLILLSISTLSVEVTRTFF